MAGWDDIFNKLEEEKRNGSEQSGVMKKTPTSVKAREENTDSAGYQLRTLMDALKTDINSTTNFDASNVILYTRKDRLKVAYDSMTNDSVGYQLSVNLPNKYGLTDFEGKCAATMGIPPNASLSVIFERCEKGEYTEKVMPIMCDYADRIEKILKR